MTPDRWAQVQNVFRQIISHPADSHDELLQQHCEGDASLRVAVESLLRHHADAAAEGFLSVGLADPPRSGDTGGLDSTVDRPVQPRANAHSEPEEGISLGDQPFPGYEVIEAIDRGGMGVVLKARQVSANRIVALKMILTGRLATADAIERFRTEAEAAARLDHPNIVPVYEVGEHRGRHFYTMGFIAGSSLESLLKERRKEERFFPPDEAADLLRTIALAVHYAHGKGIIHRDLKPANIMMDGEQPRVTDFGLAKLLENEQGLTQTGDVMGSPPYMAAEQAAGDLQAIGPRTDVYALGAILYELVTGEPPFLAATHQETLRQVREDRPVAPTTINKSIPKDLETIILKCLEKTPAARYASAQDLADELDRFQSGKPILARPVSKAEHAWRWCKRNPVVASLMSLSLLLLLTLAIGGPLMAWRQAYLRDQADANLALADARADALEKETNRANENALTAQQEADRANDLLAETYLQLARLASQRGQWHLALENLDRALELGYEDEVAVRLARVEALNALSEVAEATSEIQALSQRQDLEELEGAVLLWQGDIDLPRSNAQQTLALIDRAIQAGLDPDDAAYAAGLRADSTPAAISEFQKVLAINPFHRRAWTHLFTLLFLSGQHDEIRERLTTVNALFPDDARFDVVAALSLAARGELDAATKRLDARKKHLGHAHMAFVTVCRDIADTAEAVEQWSGNGKSRTLLAWKIITMANRVQDLFNNAHPDSNSSLSLSLTPGLEVVLRPMQDGAVRIALGRLNPFAKPDYQKIAQLFGNSTRYHPEGTLYFLEALAYVSDHDFQNAEPAAILAAETPAIFPAVEREACYAAAMCSAGRFINEQEPALLSKAAKYARRRLTWREIRPAHAEELLEVSLRAGDFHSARDYSERLLAIDPANIEWISKRAKLELAAGNLGEALRFADKGLGIDSENEEVLELRAAALKKLRTLLATVGREADDTP